MDFAWLYLYENRDGHGNIESIRRRNLRNDSNPLELPENRFRSLFRLSKESFRMLLDQVENKFSTRRNKNAIPPILKLACTLRFLAQGSYQQSVGQDYLVGMAQPTVSVVINESLNILEGLCATYISIRQSANEKRNIKEHYYSKMGFPGVIGCIDGSHVRIIRQHINEHHFYNRKGYHSINMMVISNHDLLITSVTANHGGAAHDASVWAVSAERNYLQKERQEGELNSWLLGDSGYGLEPWFITPYKLPTDGSREAKFNKVHSKCRVTIERCFGVLKGRFRCLLAARELHYQPKKAAQMINVACMLHNICVKFNVDFDESLFVQEEEIDNVSNVLTDNLILLAQAKIIRGRIKNLF